MLPLIFVAGLIFVMCNELRKRSAHLGRISAYELLLGMVLRIERLGAGNMAVLLMCYYVYMLAIIRKYAVVSQKRSDSPNYSEHRNGCCSGHKDGSTYDNILAIMASDGYREYFCSLLAPP